jgi:cytochrome c biogenesis protein CcdA
VKQGLSLIAVGHATSLLLAITFSLCVAFDLLFPNYAMYEVWLKLLPGFKWLSWKSFLLGLVESYAYGWYFALVWVPIYNVFAARGQRVRT